MTRHSINLTSVTLESLLNVHGRLTFSEKRKGGFLIFQGGLLNKLTFGQPVFLLKTVFIKSPGWILMICSIRPLGDLWELR